MHVSDSIHLKESTSDLLTLTHHLTPSTHQVERECRLHLKVPPHPHIIKLYASFEDDNNYYLVLESAEKGDLVLVQDNGGSVRSVEVWEVWEVWVAQDSNGGSVRSVEVWTESVWCEIRAGNGASVDSEFVSRIHTRSLQT